MLDVFEKEAGRARSKWPRGEGGKCGQRLGSGEIRLYLQLGEFGPELGAEAV